MKKIQKSMIFMEIFLSKLNKIPIWGFYFFKKFIKIFVCEHLFDASHTPECEPPTFSRGDTRKGCKKLQKT